jgi:hypothetical protein
MARKAGHTKRRRPVRKLRLTRKQSQKKYRGGELNTANKATTRAKRMAYCTNRFAGNERQQCLNGKLNAL